MSTDTKNNELTSVARSDARQVTPAEGKAFGALLEEIGFAPNVMFGRDATHYPLWFQRLIEGRVYAIVPQPKGPRSRSDVTKYTLLTVPVNGGTPSTNGTSLSPRTALRRSKGQQAAWTPERREKMRRTMKALWASKRTPKTLE